MHLALSGLFRARWTERIHEEWMRNLLANRPDIPRKKLQRVRELMDAHVADCLVSGYEALQFGLDLPDPDDRHVFAAAILCHAGTIVTFNVKDFPDALLAPHGIKAQHPDSFIEHAFGIDETAVIVAVRDHRAVADHAGDDGRGTARWLSPTGAGNYRSVAASERRVALTPGRAVRVPTPTMRG